MAWGLANPEECRSVKLIALDGLPIALPEFKNQHSIHMSISTGVVTESIFSTQ